ncbi:MAG: hypothetical protein CM15mP84_00530 [Cellvibrionales bacterium]|nr:MAG: hypothetical protein CM15mP84_00530 [Cellvibrionales bacterium]
MDPRTVAGVHIPDDVIVPAGAEDQRQEGADLSRRFDRSRSAR